MANSNKTQKTLLFIIFLLLVGLALIFVLPTDEIEGPIDINKFEAPDGWQHYQSDEERVSFWYPPEGTVTYEAEQVKITFIGPASQMTEITDGFTFFIQRVEFNEQELSDIAHQRFEEETEVLDGIKEPQREIVLGLDGYSFVTEGGLGNEIFYFVFHKNGATFISSHFIADPAERGYQEMIDTILESVEPYQ